MKKISLPQKYKIYHVFSLQIVSLIVFFFPSISFSQCTPPANLSTYNIGQTSANVTYSCCTGGSYYLEYGLHGFTPGTNAVPGNGGSVVALGTSTNNYLITSLLPDTGYDFCLRLNCSGTWSSNSAISQFQTAVDCANASAITCNTFISPGIIAGAGAWYSCSVGIGREKIYSFTPSVSGMHMLVTPKDTLNGSINYSYKTIASGCNGNGLTCIGYGHPSYVTQYSFGPLTVGTSYYILADNLSTDLNTSQFRIECPNCSQLTNTTMSWSGPTSFTIQWDSSAYFYLEYGPLGFMPGTGNTPGQGGTLVYGNGNSCTVTPSLQGYYDVYVRKNCNNGTYSPNSIRTYAYTSFCPQTGTYGSLGSYSNLPLNLGGYWNHYPLCNSTFDYNASEYFLHFTPPETGYYDVGVNYGNNVGILMYKQTGLCDLSGSTCLLPYLSNNQKYNYNIGPLTAGVSYDLIFDAVSTAFYPNPFFSVIINCPPINYITLSNFESNSITTSWSSYCNFATIEYGPKGFTPGAGAVAGINGTVITNATSPYTITGLLPNTEYDVYLRSQCGTSYGTNTTASTHRTAIDCNVPTVLFVGVPDSYVNSYMQVGAWSNYGCGLTTNNAIEKLYSFTPQQTKPYSLHVFSGWANAIFYTYKTSYYINSSGSCTENSWTCLGNTSFTNNTFTPTIFSLGTLTAGVTYKILVDAINQQPNSHFNYFRIESADSCLAPILLPITNVTLNSATINAQCSSCFGNITLEYGPAGFTPGTGSSAGTGGTIVTNVTFPYNLTGLTTGVTYDVYTRQNCSSLNSYSQNTTPLTFTPCSLAPSGITASPSAPICIGDSITLTANGGSVAPGGDYKWYTGTCGGTLAGIGSSISVFPTANTTYFCRIESSCGNTFCVSSSVYIFNPFISGFPTTYCISTPTTIQASSGSGFTYQWRKDSINIPGATNSTYIPLSSGVYSCNIDNGSCGSISNTINITVNNAPVPVVTATDTLICVGDQSVLMVTSPGPITTYHWIQSGQMLNNTNVSTISVTSACTIQCTVTNSCGIGTSNLVTITNICQPVIYMRVLISGYYAGDGKMVAVIDPYKYPSVCDSLRVSLASAIFPYSIIQTVTGTISTSGYGQFNFGEVPSGKYFIVVRNPNSLETWSSITLRSSSEMKYNFSASASSAFEKNLINLGDGNFAIVTGDLNNDRIIDGLDNQLLQNALMNFKTGYSPYDLNGDGITEGSDFSMLENFIDKYSTKRP